MDVLISPNRPFLDKRRPLDPPHTLPGPKRAERPGPEPNSQLIRGLSNALQDISKTTSGTLGVMCINRFSSGLQRAMIRNIVGAQLTLADMTGAGINLMPGKRAALTRLQGNPATAAQIPGDPLMVKALHRRCKTVTVRAFQLLGTPRDP